MLKARDCSETSSGYLFRRRARKWQERLSNKLHLPCCKRKRLTGLPINAARTAIGKSSGRLQSIPHELCERKPLKPTCGITETLVKRAPTPPGMFVRVRKSFLTGFVERRGRARRYSIASSKLTSKHIRK